MKFSKMLHVIDSHTAGEPTRIVVNGMPLIKGSTMAEKKQHLIDNYDYLRQVCMNEPRGHNDMFGSILTAPCHPEAHTGIIFMDGGGYLNMCGHGSIGAVTVMIETGIVEAVEPVTEVNLDTPAGLVRAKATVKDGKVLDVSIQNVPAFLYKEGVKVTLPKYGEITFDISFGGSFFAIVHANQFGLTVSRENIDELKKVGLKLRDVINETVEIQHPTLAHIKTVDLVEIYDAPTHKDATYKNIVVFGESQYDRSPCGTGTSAKVATLVKKGELKINDKFVYESILGTLFIGEALSETKVADYDAIIPQITGSAYITGFNQLVIDETDPVKHGFSL